MALKVIMALAVSMATAAYAEQPTRPMPSKAPQPQNIPAEQKKEQPDSSLEAMSRRIIREISSSVKCEADLIDASRTIDRLQKKISETEKADK